MGIIGIVSALTLPNLNSSTGDKERVAKVKKIYRDLNDAFGRAVAVYGPYSTWFINDGNDNAKKAKRVGERITEFMKTSKVCAMEANKGCFASGKSHSIGGEEITNGDYNGSSVDYKFITADGSSIAIRVRDNTSIYVDIDGPNKGSYSLGKDGFLFESSNNGFEPVGLNSSFADTISTLYNTGTTAATWIIRYDNADYLKFKNKTGLCPNNTTVTEANPRCK